jgi:hypothetical protein
VKRLVTLVLLIFQTFECCAQAETSLPPLSQMVPRAEDAGTTLTPEIAIAKWVNTAVAIITYKASQKALDRQTENALKAALPKAGKLLKETGARGALLEARYIRDAAVTGPYTGPRDLTQQLEGDQLHLRGAGNAAVDVLAISLHQKEIDFGNASRDKVLVPEATRDYWVTMRRDGTLSVAGIDHDSLYQSARDIILNDGLFMQMKASAYRMALTDMIRAAERSATTRDSKKVAGQLLSQREDALRQLDKIDNELRAELEKAKQANNDADQFALAATLAGAGASIISASQTNSVSEKKEGTSVSEKKEGTYQRIETPSGAVLEMIRIRVEKEGPVFENDHQAGAYIQNQGKTVYVPLR